MRGLLNGKGGGLERARIEEPPGERLRGEREGRDSEEREGRDSEEREGRDSEERGRGETQRREGRERLRGEGGERLRGEGRERLRGEREGRDSEERGIAYDCESISLTITGQLPLVVLTTWPALTVLLSSVVLLFL